MRRIKLWFKGLWYKFTNSSFVAHISFLWHWKNFFLCLKYPFWKTRNAFTGKFLGYSFTWYDYIPNGWRLAFGKQLSDDIKKAGKESRKRLGYMSWKKMLTWEQIKDGFLYAAAIACSIASITTLLSMPFSATIPFNAFKNSFICFLSILFILPSP